MFASCEKFEDDRQRQTSGNPIALLGIKIEKLPQTPMYLTCDFAKYHFAPSEAIEPPYYFRIDGGYFIGNDNPDLIIYGSTDPKAIKDTLVKCKMTNISELELLNHPYDVDFELNGVAGKFVFWYD